MKLFITISFLFLGVLSINAQEYFKSSYFKQNEEGFMEPFNGNKKLSNNLYRKHLGQQLFNVKSVSIYGAGLLYGLATASDDNEVSTTPSGSLGINITTSKISCNLYYSYNGEKTLSLESLENFGLLLMNPYRGGQSFSFSTLMDLKKRIALSVNGIVVNQNWELDSINAVKASPLVAKVGFQWQPFDFENIETDIGFVLKAHYTYRGIYGDFVNQPRIIDGTELKNRGYNGFDFSANIKLDSVEMYVQASINPEKDLKISGFSGTQIVFGVNVIGDLVPLK